MTIALRGRSFLRELDFTPQEWEHLLALSAELKAAKRPARRSSGCAGRTSR
jgi:ornithine carbamoyltransferase